MERQKLHITLRDNKIIKWLRHKTNVTNVMKTVASLKWQVVPKHSTTVPEDREKRMATNAPGVS